MSDEQEKLTSNEAPSNDPTVSDLTGVVGIAGNQQMDVEEGGEISKSEKDSLVAKSALVANDDDEEVSVAASSVYQQDQLPSLEEAKATLEHRTSRSPKSRRKLFKNLVITAIILSLGIAVIVLAVDKHQKPKNKLYGTGKTRDQITGRREELQTFLFEQKVSPLPALKDKNSPQSQALSFISQGDRLQLEIKDGNKLIERYVLAVLYYHLSGAKWNDRLKWLSSSDHCNWNQRYLTTLGKELHMGVKCDKTGNVISLNLSHNNVIARDIPAEISHLTNLQVFHAWNNKIGGRLPPQMKELSHLHSLVLMHNNLIGTIPDWLGGMTGLTSLGLGNNKMSGKVPDSLSKLTKLRMLGLDDNSALHGNVNIIFDHMTKLESLFLEDNKFSGTLDNIGKLTNLQEFDISNNMLVGTIPSALFNSPSMILADIHSNFLDGKFPDDMFENTQLVYFNMHDNLVKGQVSDRLGFMKNLQFLDISHCEMTGTIPDTLITMKDLGHLNTSGNKFKKQNLDRLNLSSLTNLRYLSMKDNHLTGTIPNWLGNLSNLMLLDLDANKLAGSIPSTVGLLRSLYHLLLNRNEITGTIPPQIATMRNLTTLLLDGNSITGTAGVVCQADGLNIRDFTADCYPQSDGSPAEIECRCCSTCCEDSNHFCNNKAWQFTLDAVYEYGTVLADYELSLENAPASYAKGVEDEQDDSASVDPLP